MITVRVNAKKLVIILFVINGALMILHLLVSYWFYNTETPGYLIEKLNKFLSVDLEKNLPTFYNVGLLLLTSLTFYFIGQLSYLKERSFYLNSYWIIISILFLFLALDEFATVHELFILGLPKVAGVGGSGFFKFAWVIPYGLLVVAFSIYSFKVLRSLDRKTLIGYLVSGFIYVFGALGMEIIGGKFYDNHFSDNKFIYKACFVMPEEFFEMAGLSLVIYFNLIVLEKLTLEPKNSNLS